MKFNWHPFAWWFKSTDGAEVISAYSAYWWSISSIVAPDGFAIRYPALVALAPASVWAGVTFGVGFFHSLAMCWPFPQVRTFSRMAALSWWTFATVGLALSASFSPATGTYGILAGAMIWALVGGEHHRG